MQFLFIGPGYPGVEGSGRGSGIGTYLHDLTVGLTELGHTCHVIVWGSPAVGDAADVGGVKAWQLVHTYWPGVERFLPDSRDVRNLSRLARQLDATYRFDWIEIESEEGIGIDVQRAFPQKTILRAHTTLRQMVEYKHEPAPTAASGRARGALAGSLPWALRCRLRRERRSFRGARKIVVSSKIHAAEIQRLYPGVVAPDIVHLGVGEASGPSTPEAGGPAAAPAVPRFLIVGSADRRKGFDRIQPVLAAYAARHGPCRLVIAAPADDRTKAVFGLTAAAVPRVEIVWKGPLSDDELAAEYRQATVYLHLARYESFGLPLIEAASHGTPVVSTRVGIAPELLQDDLAGCLVEGDHAEAVADTLHRAVCCQAVLGARVRERYSADFTRMRMVAGFLRSLNAAPQIGTMP